MSIAGGYGGINGLNALAQSSERLQNFACSLEQASYALAQSVLVAWPSVKAPQGVDLSGEGAIVVFPPSNLTAMVQTATWTCSCCGIRG